MITRKPSSVPWAFQTELRILAAQSRAAPYPSSGAEAGAQFPLYRADVAGREELIAGADAQIQISGLLPGECNA
ncbi:MAG: hypothetical protein QM757_41430 [Paludibaculum sp.]